MSKIVMRDASHKSDPTILWFVDLEPLCWTLDVGPWTLAVGRPGTCSAVIAVILSISQ